ncbi:MAG: hypothetical protein MUO72_05870 [Bacteroidales bacterium]|nr:hypothetical protein [Bacteroidales bacterium]
MRVTVKQSIVYRSKIVEYFDEESRSTKTGREYLPDLKNCGYTSFIYSETDTFLLLGMPGCVDNEAEDPWLVFDIKIETDGYETEQRSQSTRLNAPKPAYYFLGRNNPQNKPNVIYLFKLK